MGDFRPHACLDELVRLHDRRDKLGGKRLERRVERHGQGAVALDPREDAGGSGAFGHCAGMGGAPLLSTCPMQPWNCTLPHKMKWCTAIPTASAEWRSNAVQ